MFKDRWFLLGLLVIALSAGSAFAIGHAIRSNIQRGAGPVAPPDRPVAARPRATPPVALPPSTLPTPATLPTPGSLPAPRVAPTPAGPPVEERNAAAWQMVDAGRLRQAQEAFLQLLLVSPGNRDAMVGLVKVRRRLAGDDPAVLRRQAAAYQQAVARRTETEEHYTVEAMVLLAQASLIAAEEIEAERGRPQPRAALPTPTPPLVQATPAPRGQAPPAPRPTRTQAGPPVAQPVPTPPPATAPATPAPQSTTVEAPVDVNEPFVVVRIGPLLDSGRVQEIVGELTISGYSASVSRRDEPVSFHVVSEALAREAAERRAQVLAGFGFRSRLIARAGGLAQLDFGTFASQDEADALAGRIRSRGYNATVVREGGTGFVITAGPYRQSVAAVIVRTIRARFGAGVGISVAAAP